MNEIKIGLILVLLLGLTVGANYAEASGSKAGNGGHGVLCKSFVQSELLDLYEAREVYGIVADYVPFATVESELSRLQFELSLILPKDHPFLGLFNEALKLNETFELTEAGLGFTQDAGFLAGALSADCELTQIARRVSVGGELSYIIVQKKDWDWMLSTQQALLLFHEAAHSWFEYNRTPGELPSTLAARQIVGALSGSRDYRLRKAAVLRSIIATRQAAFTSEMR